MSGENNFKSTERMLDADRHGLMLELNRFRAQFGPVPIHDTYGEKWLIDRLLEASEYCKQQVAIACEDMVSFDDAEKAIADYLMPCQGKTIANARMIASDIRAELARLAKPVGQTNEQKVEAILRRDWSKNGVTYSQLAAEIVAALRDKP